MADEQSFKVIKIRVVGNQGGDGVTIADPGFLRVADDAGVDRGGMRDIPFALTVPTALVAAGDVLADTQVLEMAVVNEALGGMIQSITLYDSDDNNPALGLTIYFLTDDVSLGTENDPPSITDVNILQCRRYVDIQAGEWKDLGGAKMISYSGLAIPLIAKTGTRNVYLAAIATTNCTSPSGVINGVLGVLMA